MNPVLRARTHESGFTLVEALTSIVILVFGLIAVTNLLIVAGNSSQVANSGTAAAAAAVEQMEILKATPFQNLVASPGGSLDNDTAGYFRMSGVAPPAAPAYPGMTTAADNARLLMPGAGNIRVRWAIDAIDVRTYFITVRAESTSTVFSRRSRAEFTTIRACTDPLATAGVCNNPPFCCP
jgi:Tfp pilus assembly protein PilV